MASWQTIHTIEFDPFLFGLKLQIACFQATHDRWSECDVESTTRKTGRHICLRFSNRIHLLLASKPFPIFLVVIIHYLSRAKGQKAGRQLSDYRLIEALGVLMVSRALDKRQELHVCSLGLCVLGRALAAASAVSLTSSELAMGLPSSSLSF